MKHIYILIVFLLGVQVNAQIGIGTIEPATSSMLDVQSSSKGFLAPRMTTAQRTAIVQPANSLLVFDTNLQQYYFYDAVASQWRPIGSSTQTRNNYKIIKSEADLAPELAAGGGSKYLLTANTLYEINGTIVLNHSIDLNEAYVIGEDTNEDVLVRNGGTLFLGSNGGSIRGLTLSAPSGTVFNLNGTTGKNLIFRDAIVANSGSVGSVSNFGLVFFSIIQYVNNATGITYNNINQLLLNNQGWSGSNMGVFETLTGTFGVIQKVSGFSTVNGSAVGINVSSNPTVGEGIITNTAFTGTSIQFINGYTTGNSPGFKFNKFWYVEAPGIQTERDGVASANIYYDGALTTGFVQTVPTAINSPFNLSAATTTAVNMFRTDSPQSNRIRYVGRKSRTFQVNATLSVRGGTANTQGLFYSFFFRKNGTTSLLSTNSVLRINDAQIGMDNIFISGTVELAPNDYIEVWGQRLTGNNNLSSDLVIFSLNVNMQ